MNVGLSVSTSRTTNFRAVFTVITSLHTPNLDNTPGAPKPQAPRAHDSPARHHPGPAPHVLWVIHERRLERLHFPNNQLPRSLHNNHLPPHTEPTRHDRGNARPDSDERRGRPSRRARHDP